MGPPQQRYNNNQNRGPPRDYNNRSGSAGAGRGGPRQGHMPRGNSMDGAPRNQHQMGMNMPNAMGQGQLPMASGIQNAPTMGG